MKKTKLSPAQKELQAVCKEEAKIHKQALASNKETWKNGIEKKIPDKVRSSLEVAFCKAFYIVFEKGTIVIEKTYDKKGLEKDYQINDFAAQIKGGRKELRKVSKDAQRSNRTNMALSTLEGIGLGALGIGLPDIVLFVGMLLKGIYETAIRYGFSYESNAEKLLILKMMEAAMQKGDAWEALNGQIDELLLEHSPEDVSKDALDEQIQRTARVFALDMLILKFVQGLPVVGIIGGVGNPVYYRKIMRYVQLKY